MAKLGGEVGHGVTHHDEGPIQDPRGGPEGILVHVHMTDPGTTLETGLGIDRRTGTGLRIDPRTGTGRRIDPQTGTGLGIDLGTTPERGLGTGQGPGPSPERSHVMGLGRGHPRRTTRMATNLRIRTDTPETPGVLDTMMKLNLLFTNIFL